MAAARALAAGDAADDDPLDAAGLRRRYSAGRAAWAAQWREFPMYADKRTLRAFRDAARDHAVTLVISATGSGKTVVVPPLMLADLDAGRLLGPGGGGGGQGRRAVAVTIPKRVTAESAARRAAVTLDAAVGGEVGFAYRGAPPGSAGAATRLLYCTDGALLAQARRDPLLRGYAVVVVDEAHERSVPTDLLLLALRGALEARAGDLRVVIMSATIDPALFAAYFSRGASLGPPRAPQASKGSPPPAEGVAVVRVAGAPLHPVEWRFAARDATAEDYMERGVQALLGHLLSPGPTKGVPRDALMFVATTREAQEGCRLLAVAGGRGPSAGRLPAGVACAGLYGRQAKEAQQRALAPPPAPRGATRVLFATNVAESSLTVPGLGHVVDSGMQLTSAWDAAAHGVRLSRGLASRAQITQRVGRVGRTSPGVAHLLYTRATYDALPEFPPPAVRLIDMSEFLLAAMADGAGLR